MKNTILVTGGTGYLGSWVVKDLLEKAYTVRITVRDKNNKAKFTHLQEIAQNAAGDLEIREADLLKPGSFDEAAEGCNAIIHMASPFTLSFKDPQKELIDPALEGTRNVLAAASKSNSVKKVILTSSVAAVHGDSIDMQDKNLHEFTEDHFNESSSVNHQPYSYSKVLAEKEAWKIHEAQKQWKLVVINPSFVLGPSLTMASDSESLSFMTDMLTGKYRMGAPDITFGYVDVRDVAKAHILALESEKASGRHILAERTASIMEIVEIIKQKYGDKFKLPLMKSPKFILYLVGWMFGLKNRFIRRNVGHKIRLNTSKSRNELGLNYISIEKTIFDMIEQMKEAKRV